MKKPMSDIKFIFHTKSPLTIYKQMHKGNVRLNIDVHGSPYKSGQGGLYVGDAIYSPGMLHDWLKTVVDLQTIHCIRLVSCFSAYGGGSSFVCRLSRLLPEVYIKGYVNEVFSEMSPQAIGYGLGEFGPFRQLYYYRDCFLMVLHRWINLIRIFVLSPIKMVF